MDANRLAPLSGLAAAVLIVEFATLRTGMLPRWLGWAALALGIVSAIPSHVVGGVLDHIGYAGFVGLCGWMLVVARPARGAG